MTINVDEHFCKWCRSAFAVSLDENITGDFFLICPVCKHKHYRYFVRGEAVHCSITKRTDTPKDKLGYMP